jgi:hypothetical protein
MQETWDADQELKLNGAGNGIRTPTARLEVDSRPLEPIEESKTLSRPAISLAACPLSMMTIIIV